jgi:hypothetical protein
MNDIIKAKMVIAEKIEGNIKLQELWSKFCQEMAIELGE